MRSRVILISVAAAIFLMPIPVSGGVMTSVITSNVAYITYEFMTHGILTGARQVFSWYSGGLWLFLIPSFVVTFACTWILTFGYFKATNRWGVPVIKNFYISNKKMDSDAAFLKDVGLSNEQASVVQAHYCSRMSGVAIRFMLLGGIIVMLDDIIVIGSSLLQIVFG